jgi:subtilase family serine protease
VINLQKQKFTTALVLVVAVVMVMSVLTLTSAIATSPSGSMNFSKQQIVAKGFSDIGPANSSEIVPFVVYVPLKNTQELQSYVEQISNPQSANFRHFLTVPQVEARFTDITGFNNVLSGLAADGFRIHLTAMNSIILGSGTVSQIREYLGVNVDVFSNGTSSYYASYGTPLIGGVDVYVSNFTQAFFNHPTTLVSSKVINSMKSTYSQINQTFSIEPYPTTALQSVYNESGLMSEGHLGQGATIGILDFYGNPYIRGQLSYYDQIYGLPAPPSFNVVPIGPYDPNMGIATGWDGEISLDVESSHTMAPLANITLYIANGNLPLVTPIAFIDQMDSVNSLSQSFSIPESSIANFPALVTEYNIILTDLYYEMGSIEGITFSASTGDAGGSGYSSGPLGTPGYPSTSPFVTALGGTETYLVFNGNGGVESSLQTAWSNYGFVPFNVNYGGGTGGVSMLEPMPWYQMGLVSVPSSYPNGRTVPDVSLNSAIFPGMLFVFGQNVTGISGGTSEASPLFAGLVAFSVSYTHDPIGLANPALYRFGLSTVLDGKVFYPIKFGYIVPWVVTNGTYNLATGLGSLNIGAFSYFYEQMVSTASHSLNITVRTYEPDGTLGFEYPDGSHITVMAQITYNNSTVTNGSFDAILVTLGGVGLVPMSFNASMQLWIGILNVTPDSQGLAFVYVSGIGDGVSGQAYNEAFLGYYVYVESVASQSPLDLQYGIDLYGMVTWYNGTVVNETNLTLTFSYYSIRTNTYTPEFNLTTPVTGGSFYAQVVSTSETGVTMITGEGSYLYLPFMSGAQLQDSLILGPVASQPGAVAPGQNIFVLGNIMPPFNVPDFNVAFGSNLTFSLVSLSGYVLSTVFATPGTWAQLHVPVGVSPGLYNIYITSTYNSYTYGYINGSFFGQIWVSPSVTNPVISISPSVVEEGQTVNITASITQGGSPIEYGMYSATLYPASLSYEYALLTTINNIPLYYNPVSGLWEGSVVLPSGNSTGSLSYISGLLDYAGNYDLYVTGESWNGTLTTTAQSSQMPFVIHSPLLNSIQSQINLIGNEVTGLSSALNANVSALLSELNSLKAQLLYINQTEHANVTSMISQINSIESKLSTLNSTEKTQSSSAMYGEILGIVALLLSVVAIAIALTRRKKS